MGDGIVTQWKLIPDSNGLYEASENGDIRSKDRTIFRKSRWGCDSSTNKKGRILKPWVDSNGYFVIYICGFGRRQAINVHRLVAYAFHGTPDEKLDVNHKDGNKQNNSALNLEWCTKKENMKHAFETGLFDPHCKKKNSNSTRKKKITGVSIANGEIIKFDSVADAARYLGKRPGNISSAALGVLRQAYGYYWKY